MWPVESKQKTHKIEMLNLNLQHVFFGNRPSANGAGAFSILVPEGTAGNGNSSSSSSSSGSQGTAVFERIRDPTEDDGANGGYDLGNIWFNTVDNRTFMCVSLGSAGGQKAVWVEISGRSQNGAGVQPSSSVARVHKWILRDEKPVGSNGGTFVADAWQTRSFNTIAGSESDKVMLQAGGNLSLAPGEYELHVKASVKKAGSNQLRLHNVTLDSTVAYGMVFQQSSEDTVTAELSSLFSVAGDAPQVFQIQHKGSQTQPNDGFGEAAGFGAEVFAELSISHTEMVAAAANNDLS